MCIENQDHSEENNCSNGDAANWPLKIIMYISIIIMYIRAIAQENVNMIKSSSKRGTSMGCAKCKIFFPRYYQKNPYAYYFSKKGEEQKRGGSRHIVLPFKHASFQSYMVIRHHYFWLTNHLQIAWLLLTLFHPCLHICQPSEPPTTVSTQIAWLLTNPLKVKINACSRVTPFAFLPSLWLGPIWHQASRCPDGGHFSAPALALCLPRLRVPVFR